MLANCLRCAVLCGAANRVRDSRGESTFAHLGDGETPRIARPCDP